MNRYEGTVTLTVSIPAATEEDGERHLDKAVERLCRTQLPNGMKITYAEVGDDIDCMEVAQ